MRTNAEADGDRLEAVATPDEPGRRLFAPTSPAAKASAASISRRR